MDFYKSEDNLKKYFENLFQTFPLSAKHFCVLMTSIIEVYLKKSC